MNVLSGDGRDAIGFAELRANLGKRFGGAETNRDRDPKLSADGILNVTVS